jgi:arylsulfatase A-like enzyme
VPSKVNQKLNILMILTDQQALHTLGTYGSTLCQTPHLDQLAKQSVVFEEAYTTSPICTPARASLQTGLYPSHHGMPTNIYTNGCLVHELPDHPRLLSRQLLTLGYTPGVTGKWHLGNGADHRLLGGVEKPFLASSMKQGGLPTQVGYIGDDFPGHGGIGDRYPLFLDYLKANKLTYQVNLKQTKYPQYGELLSGKHTSVNHFLVDRSIFHISEMTKTNKPFFFLLNFWQPHEPYIAPSEFFKPYQALKIPPWLSFHQDTTKFPFIHNIQRNLGNDWSYIEELIKHYYATITHMDDEIGRLLAYLEANHLKDNTIIIFASDHGESLGVHAGMSDKGIAMFEETVHIPLIIHHPAWQASRRDELISLVDVYSTILEWAGLSRGEAERDGLSLCRLFESTPHWRETLVVESSGIDVISYSQRMIRSGNHKFVFHLGEMDELYDLKNDPHEMKNLAHQPEYAHVSLSMLDMLRTWLIQHQDQIMVRFDDISRAKQIYYLGMKQRFNLASRES